MDIDTFIKIKIKNGISTKIIRDSLVDTYELSSNQASSAIKRVRRELGEYHRGDMPEIREKDLDNIKSEKFHNKKRLSYRETL